MQPILRSDASYVTYSFAYGCAVNPTVALCMVPPPERPVSLGPVSPGCYQWGLSGWGRPRESGACPRKGRDERLRRSPRRRSSSLGPSRLRG